MSLRRPGGLLALLVLLAIAGFGATIALGVGETTGTNTVIATACADASVPDRTFTGPSHDLSRDGSSIYTEQGDVVTAPGATDHQCRTETNIATYTIPTVTETVATTSPPPPPPPPPPPAGTILYSKNFEDGLIDSQGWGHQAADNVADDPNSGIARGTLTVDSTTADTGSKSLKVSLPSKNANVYRSTAAQVLRTRKPDMNTDSYYTLAFKLGAGMVVPTEQPSALMTTNYQDPAGQWAAGMSTVNNVTSVYSLVNAGFTPGGTLSSPYYSGNPVGGGYSPRPAGMPGPLYVIRPGSLLFDTWYEEIFHIYSTLGNNGVVEAWIRKKGESVFTLAYSWAGGVTSIGFPTFMWTDSGGWTSSQILANNPNTSDKFGLYIASTNFERHAWFDSICRATTFEAAKACLS